MWHINAYNKRILQQGTRGPCAANVRFHPSRNAASLDPKLLRISRRHQQGAECGALLGGGGAELRPPPRGRPPGWRVSSPLDRGDGFMGRPASLIAPKQKRERCTVYRWSIAPRGGCLTRSNETCVSLKKSRAHVSEEGFTPEQRLARCSGIRPNRCPANKLGLCFFPNENNRERHSS